jgi:hypothetical protein
MLSHFLPIFRLAFSAGGTGKLPRSRHWLGSFAQSARDIVSIIQHAFPLTIASHAVLLTIRKLIFRYHTLDLVRPDAISKTSVCLDRHTLNDGVNFWHLDLYPSLRPLTTVDDFIIRPIYM